MLNVMRNSVEISRSFEFAWNMRIACYVVAWTALSFACVLGIGITVPGTKWCGPGSIAEHYDDLGINEELDTCCRAHDHCEESISPQEQRNGLRNEGVFPIFTCSCESAFRRCLSSLANMDSAALGRIYFSTTNVCFAYGPPIVTCQKNQWDMFQKRCVRYKEDVRQPPRWQFYDLGFYTHPNHPESEEGQ